MKRLRSQSNQNSVDGSYSMYSLKLNFIVLPVTAALLLSLAACENVFLLKMDKNNSGVYVTFYENGLFSDDRITACIDVLSIYRETPGQNRVWRIRARSNSCIPVDNILIGTVPRGFEQVGSYTPIQPGVEYHSEARDGRGRTGVSENWTIESLPEFRGR